MVKRLGMAILFGFWLASAQADDLQFNRDIRPILAEKCFQCHGPDARQRQADLRLDDRSFAIAAGAIDGEELLASPLLERIETDDPDLRMPPPESQKSLTADEKRRLRDWVAQGAVYQQHWAYVPPVRPQLPQHAPGKNPIDVLVEAQWERHGLRPAPPAHPDRLLRRVCLDLLGLPPDLELQTAWNGHHGDSDYERLVDQLLASPHFGERMAVAWLDVVRYADTVGYHGDQNQNVFPYRDWVIDALNRNMPFDQFTRFQIAGDLLPEASLESRMASCFNRLNMMTREGGAQPGEYLAKYAADRVRTVSAAWLGSTLGCAECHDHKYDPFTMRDFYSLAACFADLRQWGVYQDYAYTPNPDLRGWSNDHPFPPEIVVPVPYLQRRQAAFREQARQLFETTWKQAAADATQSRLFDDWVGSLGKFLEANSNGWQTLKPERRDSPEGARWETGDEGRSHVRGDPGDSLVWEFSEIPPQTNSIRLELWNQPDPASHAAAPPFNLTLSWERVSADNSPLPVSIHFADSAVKQAVYFNNSEILGIGNTWRLPASWPAGSNAVWILNEPLTLLAGEKLRVTVKGNRANTWRWSASPLVPLDCRRAEEFGFDRQEPAILSGQRTADVSPSTGLIRQWIWTGVSSERQSTREIEAQIRECRDGQAPVQVSVSSTATETRILPRGNWLDASGAVVTPAVPEFLADTQPEIEHLPPRIALAEWLVAPRNPLTARVQMNRLWKHFFGTGLTPVLDDFGLQGQYPSHPELLDWLSVEFRESGWDFKHMVKQIVMSETYRRSAVPAAGTKEIDPRNQWLSHQNARRLEAEIVRDNALAAAGILVRDVGGPPVFPYQPPGYYAQLQFPDRDYPEQHDDRRFRRGVYLHWQRTFLHPMLANFDAPPREECTGMRIEANTPLQALTLLNDPAFLEAAAGLAQRCIRMTTDDASRIQMIFRCCLGRDPSSAETESLLEFVAQQRREFLNRPDDAQRLIASSSSVSGPGNSLEIASWICVCRVILNLHETITRY